MPLENHVKNEHVNYTNLITSEERN